MRLLSFFILIFRFSVLSEIVLFYLSLFFFLINLRLGLSRPRLERFKLLSCFPAILCIYDCLFLA